jgi:hypothetical protein
MPPLGKQVSPVVTYRILVNLRIHLRRIEELLMHNITSRKIQAIKKPKTHFAEYVLKSLIQDKKTIIQIDMK